MGWIFLLVGVSGFEPEASWTRTKRDTKLRHTPKSLLLYRKNLHLSTHNREILFILRQVSLLSWLHSLVRGDIMGYRVDYGPVKQERKGRSSISRVLMLTAVCLLVFLLLVNSFCPRGAEVLRSFLLPGDAAVTAAALEELSAELQNGEDISSALESFCRKIIQNAHIDPG